MQNKIPQFLYKILLKQYGENVAKEIIKGYTVKRKVTLRVNTLKTNVEEIKKKLIDLKITFKEVLWYKDALIIENASENDIRKLDIYDNGEIYLQSLSSMIPAIILNPKFEENILDMTAAPGGKTTQMAAISSNRALITACEKNKIRAERLKYNITKQGASRVNVLHQDARKLNEYFSFDKILLDAPCSGSGTININNEELERFFTQELINRSIQTQKDLLNKAINVLKCGGELVYSTCSILKNENENNLLEFINKKHIQIIPIDKEIFKSIPLLPVNIEGTICVAPNELYEGFFVAKIRKNK